MHEIEKIAAAIERITNAGRRGLLVTVAGTRGSTYRRAGARCVIADDGEVFGAISGGCLERDLAERAKSWSSDFAAHVITYDSSRFDDIVFGLGLGCRGNLEILVQPFDARHMPNLPSGSVHATVIHPPSRTGEVIDVTGKIERTCRMDIGGCDVLVEVIRPKRAVVMFGGGGDVDPVAAFGRALGWRVDVIAPKDCHPEAVSANLDLSRYDGAVIMTHNFLHDLALLDALFATSIPYIGLLGPKARGEELMERIGNVTADMRQRLHNPAGLDLGGETPEEIALSIAGEIQAVLNGRAADSLREKNGPIHDSNLQPIPRT